MTDKLRAAALLALEALDTLKIALRVGMPEYGAEDQDELLETAITALRAALEEQPAEQEHEGSVCGRCGGLVFDPVLPQPAKQPLTDEEIDVLWAKQQTKPFKTHAEDRMAFARAIERAHGIGEQE